MVKQLTNLEVTFRKDSFTVSLGNSKEFFFFNGFKELNNLIAGNNYLSSGVSYLSVNVRRVFLD
jgi:hypothetical protein